MIVARYAGLLRYFRKHRPSSEVTMLRFVVAVLAALRALVFIPIDRPRARAYFAVLTRTDPCCSFSRSDEVPRARRIVPS